MVKEQKKIELYLADFLKTRNDVEINRRMKEKI